MIKTTLTIAVAMTQTACGGSGGTSAPALLDDTSSEPVPIVSTPAPDVPVAAPDDPVAPTVVPVAVVMPEPEPQEPAEPTPSPVEPVSVVTPEPEPAPTVEPVTPPEPELIDTSTGEGTDTGTLVDIVEPEPIVSTPEALNNLITTDEYVWHCTSNGSDNAVVTFHITNSSGGTWGAFTSGTPFVGLSWVVEADTLVLTSNNYIDTPNTTPDFALTGILDTPDGFSGMTPDGIEFDCIKTNRADITGDELTPAEYSLGDTGPGGGIVFYVTNGGLHGLEAAPEDQEPAFWCGIEMLEGATGTAIGTGASNTAVMLEQCPDNAADVASSYNGGGFEDWFLPSRDELVAMSNNLGFACTAYSLGYDDQLPALDCSPYYWSSTELSASTAMAFHFGDYHGPDELGKINDPLSVRAVRAF